MFETKEHLKLRKEFEGYLAAILTNVAEAFSIEKANGIINGATLAKFWLFKNQQNPQFKNAWKITKDGHSFYITSVDIDSTLVLRGRTTFVKTQTHTFLYCLLNTAQDFGISLIRPETIEDKIIELFQRTEIDFKEDRLFSWKYFCQSKTEEQFKGAVTLDLMEYLSGHSGLQLEFSGDLCLFKTEKSIIAKEDNLALFHTGLGLSRLIGK